MKTEIKAWAITDEFGNLKQQGNFWAVYNDKDKMFDRLNPKGKYE